MLYLSAITNVIPKIVIHPVCVREKDEFFYERIAGKVLTSAKAKDSNNKFDYLKYDSLISAKNQCAKYNKQGGKCAAIQEKTVGGSSVFYLHSSSESQSGGGSIYLVHRSADFVAWEKTRKSYFKRISGHSKNKKLEKKFDSINKAKQECEKLLECAGIG